MRYPDSDQFVHWNELMASGQMVGMDRPVGRITVSKNRLHSVTSDRPGPWRHELFLDPEPNEWEIQSVVQSIRINRSIGQDSATCTIEMINFSAESTTPQGDDDIFGRPGYLTFNRGREVGHRGALGGVTSVYGGLRTDIPNEWGAKQPYPTEWGYPTNKYRDILIPNTLIRTYQGYGSDNMDENGNLIWVDDDGYVLPQDDSKCLISGTWLIDKVTYTSDWKITIECRDMAKLLIEQYIYPPMIPLSRFPLTYCPAKAASGSKGGPGKNVGKYHSSSVDPWDGHNAAVFGHRGTDAFDGRPDSYWLSVGNASRNDGYSFEWLQADCGGNEVNEITFKTIGGHYSVYVSVMENGVWQGTDTVPYDPNNPASFPNGANIKFVKFTTSGNANTWQTIKLPRTYKAKYVRLCFTNLWNSGLGTYKNRAGVREMLVRYSKADTYKASTVGKPKYIQDWSEAVKELCGWAGFTWVDAAPAPADPLLGKRKSDGAHLRVWGDFEVLGAGPIVCTPGDYFMNKSFMEGVRMIADFLGCIFFVDEWGGANFRLPNIFGGGNFITDPDAPAAEDESSGLHSFGLGNGNGSGTATINAAYMQRTWPVEFHENANLVSYSMTIDDSQVRSEVLVVGDAPDVTSTSYVAGGYVLGANADTGDVSAIDFRNVLAGQTRLFLVPGDATKGFKTERECQRMAELTALFILFAYRKGTLTAPCHPGLQLDDQVRIYERVTYENNVHYVSGIDTTMDVTGGSWTMNVTTHWLGEDPDTQWFLDKQELTPAVKNLPAIIARMGKATTDDGSGLAGKK